MTQKTREKLSSGQKIRQGLLLLFISLTVSYGSFLVEAHAQNYQ